MPVHPTTPSEFVASFAFGGVFIFVFCFLFLFSAFGFLASWLFGFSASRLLGFSAFCWLMRLLVAFWLWPAFPVPLRALWLFHPFIGVWIWLPASSASPPYLNHHFFEYYGAGFPPPPPPWQGRLRTMCRRAPSRAERLIVAHELFWCNPKSRKECLGMPHPERTS